MDLTAETLRQRYTYDPETGVFTHKQAVHKSRLGKHAGFNDGQGYTRIYVLGRLYRAHRLAWLYVTGQWPVADIDHINRVRSDNRWSNLRSVSRQENLCNAGIRSDSKSGVTGVHWLSRDKRWGAEISNAGKRIRLGYFTNFEEAVAVRAKAKTQFHSNQP
jgi:hypothetical protein